MRRCSTARFLDTEVSLSIEAVYGLKKKEIGSLAVICFYFNIKMSQSIYLHLGGLRLLHVSGKGTDTLIWDLISVRLSKVWPRI